MDIVDRIETARFVGCEFLVWLWFASEATRGHMDVNELGECDVWLDTTLSLESFTDEGEKTTLKGRVPSQGAEAREALRQGKLPVKARVCISTGEGDFAAVIDARTFAVSGAHLHEFDGDDSEESFFERMTLLEELERRIGALYAEFLRLRLSPAWEKKLAPAIADWVRSDDLPSEGEYSGLVR